MQNGTANLTLTATLSHTTYAATTVDLDGSAGAATEGTDYATLSNITINANETTGTTAFNPTPSTSYEAITETANVAIASVSGGGGAIENGNQECQHFNAMYSLNIGTFSNYNNVIQSGSTPGISGCHCSRLLDK